MCWQAEFSKVTAATVNALLIIEGNAGAHSVETLEQACAAAIGVITRHCGGTAEVIALPS